jgi:hypothetical protein
MKKVQLLFIAILSIAFGTAKAQTPVVTLPDWGPAGYDNARYYYIPAIETYYDVGTSDYIYRENGKWVRNTSLPKMYADYDLYDTYKVVLTDDYKDRNVYDDWDKLSAKYGKTYVGDKQKTIKIKKNKVKIKEK